MLLDAIILAGGRSSRLSGVPKAQLRWRGSTLLQNTVGAALDAGAGRVVVVGPGDGSQDGWAGVQFVREDPPFGGPAAAVAAGMRALEQETSDADANADADADADANADADVDADLVLVLACDMPGVAAAVAALLSAVPTSPAAQTLATSDGSGAQGAILLDPSGMRQPLAAIYSRSALAEAIAGLRASGTLDSASMRTLTSSLELLERADPHGATCDVDTWNDAAGFGIEPPGGEPVADARRSRS